MQAVVLIPTYDRPELLVLCLDALAKCAQPRDVDIRVYVDRRLGHADLRDISQACERHPGLGIVQRISETHGYRGNSYNVLRAYADALHEGYDWIYLIEDDILVSPEFFAWHQSVHRRVTVAASMGVSDPGHGAYASLGVCLPAATVARIVRHGTKAYLRDMRAYCAQRFPPSGFGHEQDGLIARILAGQQVAWAAPPVVSHVGWYGYHRRDTVRPQGTLDTRVAHVRAVTANAERLRRVSHDSPHITLATAPNLGTYTVSTVPGVAA